MREQSLLDEMRAAVRGDRERAEKRREQEVPGATEPEPEPVTPEPVEPEVEEDPPQRDGFWGRLTRR